MKGVIDAGLRFQIVPCGEHILVHGLWWKECLHGHGHESGCSVMKSELTAVSTAWVTGVRSKTRTGADWEDALVSGLSGHDEDQTLVWAVAL